MILKVCGYAVSLVNRNGLFMGQGVVGEHPVSPERDLNEDLLDTSSVLLLLR